MLHKTHLNSSRVYHPSLVLPDWSICPPKYVDLCLHYIHTFIIAVRDYIHHETRTLPNPEIKQEQMKSPVSFLPTPRWGVLPATPAGPWLGGSQCPQRPCTCTQGSHSSPPRYNKALIYKGAVLAPSPEHGPRRQGSPGPGELGQGCRQDRED